MMIDIHTHIFPDDIRQERERFFHDESAFRLLYASPKAKLAGFKELLAAMDHAGIDKSVAFGFPWRTAERFKRHNDYVLEAMTRHPDRIAAFCCLDALHPAAPAEVERCLAAGMAGVGELAFYTSGIDEVCLTHLDPIMALCRKFDRPMMIHTNEPVGHLYPGKTPNTLAQIYTLIRRYPQNRIILAHWGGGLFFYALLKKEVRDAMTQVWFDTAASPFLYQSEIYRQALTLAGPDKVLLGTDYPLLSAQRYFDDMRQAGLDLDQRRRICGDNAAVLLKLTSA